MSDLKLVFAHGWAMGDWFWEPLQSVILQPGMAVSRAIPETDWVGIGHSLGFRKLAESDLTNCRGLVSLSGFFGFSEKGGTPRRVVKRMLKQFGRNPQNVLKEFYKNCGFEREPVMPVEAIDLGRELNSLLDEFERVDGKISDWRGIQVFAIAGEQDKIVPRELSQRQFANVAFHPEAGHSLGFDFPDWCAEQIRPFLDSL